MLCLSHQRFKDITSHRVHCIWIERSVSQINSPVPSSSNEMIICNYITNESLYFGYQQWHLVNASIKYVITPGIGVCSFRWNLTVFDISIVWEKQSRHTRICTLTSKKSTPQEYISHLSHQQCNYINQRGITWFWCQDPFPWINSPVPS